MSTIMPSHRSDPNWAMGDCFNVSIHASWMPHLSLRSCIHRGLEPVVASRSLQFTKEMAMEHMAMSRTNALRDLLAHRMAVSAVPWDRKYPLVDGRAK